MLASILPGFRHVRTPFAAGALYVVFLWLVASEAIITTAVSTEFGRHLLLLSDLVGRNATAAALGFIAYLVGSLAVISGPRALPTDIGSDYHFRPHAVDFPQVWHQEYNSLPRERWAQRWRNWRRSRRPITKAFRFAGTLLTELFRRNSYYRSEIASVIFPILIGRPGFHTTLVDWSAQTLAPALNQGLSPSILEEAPNISDDFNFMIRDALGHRYMYPEMREQRERMSADQSEEADTVDGHWLIVERVATYVRDEINILTIRLQIERPELYNDYDRMKSEAEFRFTISPAIALIAIVATFQWSPWALVLILLPLALTVTGVRRQVGAESLMWQALSSNQIESPIMQAILAIPLDDVPLSKVRFKHGGP